MRILFVNEKCGYFGGVEQNIAHTARGLAERGHECYLAFGSRTSRSASDYESLFRGCFRCSELCVEGEASVGEPLSAIRERLHPDVTYLHKVASLDVASLARGGERIVRMIHDHDLCCPRRHKYSLWTGRVCERSAGWRCWLDGAFVARSSAPWRVRWASIPASLDRMRANRGLDAILVGSRFMRDELRMNGFPESRVRIVPPVVRFARVESAPPPPDLRILYAGQLIRGKGVDLLLQALSRLTGDFLLTLVGDGNARTRLETLSRRLGLSSRVRFEGWVDPDRLGDHYRRSRIVVVPSRWPEPFGMVGLEAMHHSRAVVAFDVGGIRDWLEPELTGLLVPEQDTQRLARAIERVHHEDGLAESMGRRGRRRVEERFSFEGYLDELLGALAGDRSREPVVG